MAKALAPKRRRLLIVTDGERWYVRRVASVHALDRGEAIYTCDKAIGRSFDNIADAVRRAKDALSNRKSRAWR